MDVFIFYFVCSFVLGALGAWLISRWGNVFNLLDRSNHRSSHEGVIPKGGGIGILAAFIFASLFLKLPPAFWLAATVLSLFSLLGDRVEISPKFRLPIQFIAAFSFLLLTPDLLAPLGRVPFQGVQPGLPLAFNALLLTAFFAVFMVATANWYNFMDGINGIAAITGVCSFGLLALFNHVSGGDSRFTILTICIAFSCLGFLPFNFPNAKVFMGDVGSILLGFVFSAIVVMLSKSFLDFICLAGFLFPFYADEFVTMAVRLKDGENLLKAHRRHFYQLLANEMGIDHWKVTIGYGILQLIVGAGILLARPLGILPVFVLLFIFFSGFILANYFVRKKSWSMNHAKNID